jgi:hypothetical protein
VAALKSTGLLIISLLHPCFDEASAAWSTKGYVEVREYFQERAVPQTYGVVLHRTLSTYLNAPIKLYSLHPDLLTLSVAANSPPAKPTP